MPLPNMGIILTFYVIIDSRSVAVSVTGGCPQPFDNTPYPSLILRDWGVCCL